MTRCCELRSRLGDKLLKFYVVLCPARDCGPKRVNPPWDRSDRSYPPDDLDMSGQMYLYGLYKYGMYDSV